MARCMGQRRRYTTVSRSVKSVCRSSFSLPLVRHRKGPCGRLLRAGLPLVDNPLPVVIADDDPDIREMVRTALQLDGFHVLEASNGQTAWELILARRPAVVLADVQMPGIGGLELTARIKAHGYHETKVILFTGGMATEKQAQMAGADAYVTKSAPLSELRAAVRRLCPRTA